MEYNVIDQLIQNRRAIYPKMFSSKPLEDKVVEQLLQNANWAPTHRLTEPWRFVVFKGGGLKKLANFQAGLYKKRSEQEGNYEEAKYQKLLTKPLLCSHVIAVGMKRHEVVPQVEEICATACAVQNLWLTASAMGVGCYWSTGGATYYEEAKEFFGLGQADKLMGFINLGNYEGQWPKGKRKPIGEKMKWVR